MALEQIRIKYKPYIDILNKRFKILIEYHKKKIHSLDNIGNELLSERQDFLENFSIKYIIVIEKFRKLIEQIVLGEEGRDKLNTKEILKSAVEYKLITEEEKSKWIEIIAIRNDLVHKDETIALMLYNELDKYLPILTNTVNRLIEEN